MPAVTICSDFRAPKNKVCNCLHCFPIYLPWRTVMTNLDSILKGRDITLSTKIHLVKAMVFPVVMYGCESWTYKESWMPKNWCFWTVVLEKTLESPLDCKEIQPVHPKGDQSWVFIGRTDVEAETPILWPTDAKSWLIWNDPDAGKDWRQEEKGMTEDEMVGWHYQLHWVNSSSWWWTGKSGMLRWGRKALDMTERLNWTESKLQVRNKELFRSKFFPIILCQCSIKKGYCNIHMS